MLILGLEGTQRENARAMAELERAKTREKEVALSSDVFRLSR